MNFPEASLLDGVRIAIGLVWIVFGLLFKVANLVPRHRRIVARVVGERFSGSIVFAVGLAEAGLGVWMFSGRELVVCATIQTLALTMMNALELRYARDLLLSPRAMLILNLALLSTVWVVALTNH